MTRPSAKSVLVVLALGLLTVLMAACGREVKVDKADNANANVKLGAELFYERCSGCHTLDTAAAEGSATKVRDRERVDGPNFNVRPEDKEAVLYAIRNGGFSGAIMPENIVVGAEANAVAEFLAKYAGRSADKPVTPSSAGDTP